MVAKGHQGAGVTEKEEEGRANEQGRIERGRKKYVDPDYIRKIIRTFISIHIISIQCIDTPIKIS